jgi:hypothetical protein
MEKWGLIGHKTVRRNRRKIKLQSRKTDRKPPRIYGIVLSFRAKLPGDKNFMIATCSLSNSYIQEARCKNVNNSERNVSAQRKKIS